MSHQVKLETGGSVWQLPVAQGDAVTVGQELFVMEVMKMEVAYEAPVAGTITALHIAEGDVLTEGFVALEIG